MIKDHYVNVPIFDLSVCLWKFAPAWFNMVQVHQISGYQQGSTGRSCSTIRSETNSARLLGTSVSWLGTNRPCGDHHKMAPKPMVISWISHGLRSLLRSLKLEFFGTVDVDIHDYDMMSKISSECHIPWYPIISHPVHDDTLMGFWWHSDGIGRVQSSDLDLLEIQWETCSAQRKRISGSSSSSSAKHLKWCWNWKMGNSLSDSDMILMEFHGECSLVWLFLLQFWMQYIYIYYIIYIYTYIDIIYI